MDSRVWTINHYAIQIAWIFLITVNTGFATRSGSSPWLHTTALITWCTDGRHWGLQCQASVTDVVMMTAASRRLGKSRHADSSIVGMTRLEQRWLEYSLLRANNTATWRLSTTSCTLSLSPTVSYSQKGNRHNYWLLSLSFT